MLLGILAKRAEKLIVDNAPAILTAIGVTGTLSTAWLTAKAAIKTTKLIEAEEAARAESTEPYEPMTKADKAELVWKLYIPAAISAGMTITAVILSNRVGARRAAAVASAYGLAEKALEEFKKKTRETVGEDKEREIRTAIAKDVVDKAIDREIHFVGSGNFLCVDAYSGRPFRATREDIRAAVNTINSQIHGDNYASLTDFWNELGLEGTSESDNLGWNTDQLIAVDIDGGIAKDGEPFILYTFRNPPKPRYHLSSY
jgi:hypothetical protein